ncbi:DUF1667 domain-containing protein [Olsenella massiliensis]|uniref:DUF1667 domain-containing protein n=1 Tax=Olsenella massiliensis TaxID=1622075 RepID=UPI00071C5CCB|nr:DUF1667 domain-containing protein [Olsenella massiliensis]
METRRLTCINCPMGCQLEVTVGDGGKVVSVTGNGCRRGDVYGRKEVTNPTRTVTSTVVVRDGASERVSVKTKEDVPKRLIFDVMDVINRTTVTAPVHVGDVLVDDVCGTGVPLVATAEVGVR